MARTATQLRRRIHLAYAAASSGLPAPLVQALEAAGFEVSHAPSTYTDDAALEAAKTVLVCWTPAAGLAETWQEIGALTAADDTLSATAAYRRAAGLAPNEAVARFSSAAS